MVRQSHHVVHNSGGGWDVKKGGADRASGHFETKAEAIDAGRDISIKQRTEFVIHNMDGRIAESDSHGGDPYPPRG